MYYSTASSPLSPEVPAIHLAGHKLNIRKLTLLMKKLKDDMWAQAMLLLQVCPVLAL